MKRPTSVVVLLLFLFAAARPAAAQVRITGFAPVAGVPGTEVTIQGSGLGGVTQVFFGDSTGGPAQILGRTATRLVVIVPLTAVSGPIQAGSPAGSGTSTAFFEVGPRITSFTPTNGVPLATTVTIAGANFALGAAPRVTHVTFNGVRSPLVQVLAASQLQARVPTNATTGLIRVFTPAGEGVSAGKFHLQPLLTRFTPTNGAAGDVVTLVGSSFDDATSVRLGSVELPFTVASPSNLLVTLTTNAVSGRFLVTAPGGAIQSVTNFPVLPGIASFSPASGAPGTNVTLAGAAFTGVQEVRFGSLTATFTVDSANVLRAVVPANAFSAPLSVRTTNGTALTTESFFIRPTITGLTPAGGTNGTEVTVNGRNFTGATNVAFNGAAAVFTVVSSNRIAAVVPAAATTGPVTVFTPGGSAASANFTVRPVITGFDPVSAARGAAFEVLGSGLTNIQSVTFAQGGAATFTGLTPNRLRVIVPAGAFSGPVTVQTAGGGATSPGPFFVTGAAPQITAFTPAQGGPGTAVTIAGLGLGTAQGVTFNGVAAAAFLPAGANVTATVPAGAGSGPIAVATLDGEAVSTQHFIVPLDEATLGVSNRPPNVVFFWPVDAAGFGLEFTTQLRAGTAWQPVPVPPTQAGSNFILSLPAVGQPAFFRLKK